MAINIEVNSASKSAILAVEKAGGKVKILENKTEKNKSRDVNIK